MSRVAYVDGQYVPHRSAAVHIEDRGYQFADGVYEVMVVITGACSTRGRIWRGSQDRWRNCELPRRCRTLHCGS